MFLPTILLTAGLEVQKIIALEIPDEVVTGIIALVVALLGWLLGKKKKSDPD